MQVSGEGGKSRDHSTSFHAVKNVYKNEGLLGFYNGFSANIARQLAYTMTKLGLFQFFREELKK
jgi:solute carrier family 25 oxoglutarate transporter 11